MDIVLNALLFVASAALAPLMSRRWRRRRDAAVAMSSAIEQLATFSVVGISTDGRAYSLDTAAANAETARRKAEALGISVLAVMRSAA